MLESARRTVLYRACGLKNKFRQFDSKFVWKIAKPSLNLNYKLKMTNLTKLVGYLYNNFGSSYVIPMAAPALEREQKNG